MLKTQIKKLLIRSYLNIYRGDESYGDEHGNSEGRGRGKDTRLDLVNVWRKRFENFPRIMEFEVGIKEATRFQR